MKAIITSYLGPTNTKPSRISVKAEGVPTVRVSYDSRFDAYEAHHSAASDFATRLGWLRDGLTLVGGSTPDQRGYAFVFVRSSQ